MVNKDQHKNGDKWNYEPTLIDLKFLKAVDYIIGKNKAAKAKPDTDSSISKTIFGRSNIIREIRNFQRGVAMTELHKFAIYFRLDFNYFFRHTMCLEYNPQVAGGNENIIIGERIDIINKMEGGTVYRGDIYIGSKIIKVEKIVLL